MHTWNNEREQTDVNKKWVKNPKGRESLLAGEKSMLCMYSTEGHLSYSNIYIRAYNLMIVIPCCHYTDLSHNIYCHILKTFLINTRTHVPFVILSFGPLPACRTRARHHWQCAESAAAIHSMWNCHIDLHIGWRKRKILALVNFLIHICVQRICVVYQLFSSVALRNLMSNCFRKE